MQSKNDGVLDLRNMTLGGFYIERRQLAGVRADLWQAHDEVLDVPVSLMVLQPRNSKNEKAVKRFAREARVLAHLEHQLFPAVRRVEELEHCEQALRCLVLDVVPGESLHEAQLARDDAIEVVLSVAEGLKHAHGRGVAHGDLTPSNIFLKHPEFQCKLIGFASDSDSEAAGDVVALSKLLPSLMVGKDLSTLNREDFLPAISKLEPEIQKFIENSLPESSEEPPELKEFIGSLKALLPDSEETTLSRSTNKSTRATNLQPAPTSFIGRSEEINELTALLEKRTNHLATLLGPGGVGKTRLLQECGTRTQPHFPGGVWFCDLTAARSKEDCCREVARALGVPLTQGNMIAQLGDALGLREASLLLLDNLEQVIEPASHCLMRWRQEAPDIVFLCSSREALQLEGEHIVEVQPLDPSSDALDLFCDRARTRLRSFQPEDEELRDIAAICESLDGIPLAVELAASRVPTLSVRQLRERLGERLDLLKTKRRDLSPRQQTMRGAIEWSWQTLDDIEKLVLLQCSVFRGGFLLEDAEAIVSLPGTEDQPFILDVIDSLVRKSLLRSEESDSAAGELRFSLYEVVRQFAEEELDSIPIDRDKLAERHANYFVRRSLELGPDLYGKRQIAVSHRISGDFANYASAHVHLLSARQITSDLIGSCTVLIDSLEITGPWRERIIRAELVLTQLRGDAVDIAESNPIETLQIAQRVAQAYAHLGDNEALADVANFAADFAMQIESNKRLSLRAKLYLMTIRWLDAMRSGRLDSVESDAIDLVRLCDREQGDSEFQVVLAKLHRYIALWLLKRDGLEAALEHSSAGEKLFENAGDERGLAQALVNRMVILLRAEVRLTTHRREVLSIAERCKRLFAKLDDPKSEAVFVGNLGVVYTQSREFKAARELYRSAEKINREFGDTEALMISLGNLGNLAYREDNLERADEYYREAIRLAHRIADSFSIVTYSINLSATLRLRGELGAALRCTKNVEELSKEHPEETPLESLCGEIAQTLFAQARTGTGEQKALMSEAREYANRELEICRADDALETIQAFEAHATLALCSHALDAPEESATQLRNALSVLGLLREHDEEFFPGDSALAKQLLELRKSLKKEN